MRRLGSDTVVPIAVISWCLSVDLALGLGGFPRCCELAAGSKVRGDVTTLEDQGVLAKLRSDED